MRAIAYILAIICIIVAAVYFAMPADQLPTFMPGYEAGSTHIHTKHAIVAVVAAVILAVIGWLVGRRN
jgi:uncharacterized membrane protein